MHPHGLPANEHGGRCFSTDPKTERRGGTRSTPEVRGRALPDCSHTKIPEDAPMPSKGTLPEEIELPPGHEDMTEEEAAEYFRQRLASHTVHSNHP